MTPNLPIFVSGAAILCTAAFSSWRIWSPRSQAARWKPSRPGSSQHAATRKLTWLLQTALALVALEGAVCMAVAFRHPHRRAHTVIVVEQTTRYVR